MDNTRLSHSSVSKFQECPQAWDYHYNQKLRYKLQSSALLFGSALDKALEAQLRNLDPYKIFHDVWSEQYINKTLEQLPECTKIVYADSDVDLDLIDKKQRLLIEEKYPNWEYDYKQVMKSKETLGFNNLADNEKKLINYVAWHSLYTKGVLMIDAFREKIVPKIKKVLALQKEIELTNEHGDKVIGFADLVCEWEDGTNVVIDFKTSTRNYDESAVLVSPQLSLYVYCLSEEFNTRKAGYIVLNKKVNKNKVKMCSKCGWDGTGNKSRTCPQEINEVRCAGAWLEHINPEIYIQTIIDEIPEQTENIVIDNIEYINQSIKTGVFHRNFSSCVKPWGKCAFFNLCYKNDDSDLIKV